MSLNSDLDALTRALGVLDDRLVETFPEAAAALRPGVPAGELDEFEAEFGSPLPQEFRVLYAWHDGADPAVWHSLPGWGQWVPLFVVIDLFVEWQESWELGFHPRWIPITTEQQRTIAIDATGPPHEPASIIRYEIGGDLINRSASVLDGVEQMIDVLERGLWHPTDDYDMTRRNGDDYSLFSRSRMVEIEPNTDDLPPGSRLKARFEHDLSTDPIATLYARVLEGLTVVGVLLDTYGGRDRLAVGACSAADLDFLARNIGKSELALISEAAPIRWRLETAWRVLERNAPNGGWRDAWRAVERDALSLQQSPQS